MKQLIMTFFLILLCYSLFFNKKTENLINDEINFKQKDVYTPLLPDVNSDTVNYMNFNSSMAMFSTWWVCGNMSTGCTLLTR